MDRSKVHNPYDFSYPVSDADLFIGRQDEMDEITYYLDHAKTAPRPMNIALLGPRSSGKTSILNMVDAEASKRGFCTVRLDLDEDDGRTQLRFFHKIFDGILTKACGAGTLGGKEGKTYDTYLDIVNAYIIPEDKTFCPFVFPLQYAKAMSSKNIDAPISEHNYKEDLIKIHSAMNRPIILLFDECNVLANSRVHLEKLRNIFINTPGFMIVVTGTPTLFPVMDEVFSPIVRQFIRITIGEFKDSKETQECVSKPLAKIGFAAKNLFDPENYDEDLQEIHDLSGGRPYEVQLICHYLFRRIELGQATKMKLDLNVLEAVRKQLETQRDITIRPILTGIRSLEKSELLALNILCACDGRANFAQIWAIEYIFRDERNWTRDTLESKLEYFVSLGILEGKERIKELGFKPHAGQDLIKFAGDDYDKIYTKYLAREQGLPFIFRDVPLEIHWLIELQLLFGREPKTLRSMAEVPSIDTDIDFVENIAVKMASEDSGEDLFTGNPSRMRDMYFLMLTYREKEIIPIVSMQLILPWLKVHSWHYAENPDNTEVVDDVFHKVQSLKERADEVGGKLVVKKKDLPVAQVDILARKVESTDNREFRERIARTHAIRMSRQYAVEGNIDAALFHANLSYRYNPTPTDSFISNNLGYMFMTVDVLDKARALLLRAVDTCDGHLQCALGNYNLGILEAKEGDLPGALAKIKLCIKRARKVEKQEREMACLFVPRIVNKKLKFEEVRESDILDVAREAQNTLQFLLNTHK